MNWCYKSTLGQALGWDEEEDSGGSNTEGERQNIWDRLDSLNANSNIRAQRKKHRLRQKRWTEVEKKISISMGFPTSVPEKGALEEYMDSEKDAMKVVYKEGLLNTGEMKLA